MSEIKPIVSDVTIGNATVGIDCVWLKCVESVDLRLTMEEVPIVCDWASGPATYLRGNPTGELTISAMNLNSVILGYALDATVSTKAADESVTCEEHQLTWVPDSLTTPTEWTATVTLNSPEVDTVLAYTDSGCSTPWASATTPLNTITVSNSCAGIVVLTTNDVDETDDTLYFAYDHDIETPVGATLIKASFSTFADDHKVHILHRNATTGNLELIKLWRVQIIPDFNIKFDNSSKVVTVPIKMRVLADRDNHSDAPLGIIAEISATDSEATDFTNSLYTKVRSHI